MAFRLIDDSDSSPKNVPTGRFKIIPEPEESTGKSLARYAAQIPGGAAEMSALGITGNLANFIGTGESLAELEELEERIPELKKMFPTAPWENFKGVDREKYMEAVEGAQSYNPFTVSGLSKIIEESTGLPLEAKTRGQKGVRFLAGAGKLKPGTLTEKLKFAGKATASKEILQSLGVPEPIAELGGLLTGDIKLPKISRGQTTKMTSGLTQPKAVEARQPKLGTITSGQQENAFKKLDKEATELTKKSIQKHQPIAKKIEEGFDFESKFQKEFGEIQKTAEKANPEIDVTPISETISKNAKKYRGIPNPHPEAQKIIKEVRAFRNLPQTSLRNLLKIYRSNNSKLKNIFETAHVTGKQKEYVDFLRDYNSSIEKSFKQTLPIDSTWMKNFENLNKEYSSFKKTQSTINQLKDVFGENPTLKQVERLAKDVQRQKKLSLSMGKEGAQEIIQIGKDLTKAKESIKNIPKKEWGKWDKAFPLAVFIPFAGKPIAGIKGIQATRAGYGWFLTTPARRKAYNLALQAIDKKDFPAYLAATKLLKKELGQPEQD